MLVGTAAQKARGREGWSPQPGQRNIVIFGPPGVGKGTQSAAIVERFGCCHISTGELLRDEISRDSPLGRRVKQAVSSGTLVSDEVLLRLLRRRLATDKACKLHGWLLDGFPRTASQARLMLGAGLVPHHILILNARAETVVGRILNRAREARSAGRPVRKDDTAEVARKRLTEYAQHKDATLAAFAEYLRVVSVDGDQNRSNVTESIGRVLAATEATQTTIIDGEQTKAKVGASIARRLDQPPRVG